jgi:prepilin-type N-terminal cleavage/methylation domain-containing protein
MLGETWQRCWDRRRTHDCESADSVTNGESSQQPPGKRLMKSEKGVTLIEVAISIAVLGLVAVAVTGYFKWTYGIYGFTDRKATADSLARTQIEQIKNDLWSDTGDYTIITHPSGYSVTYAFATVSPTLQKITVTASPNNVPAEAVVLEAYKANR